MYTAPFTVQFSDPGAPTRQDLADGH